MSLSQKTVGKKISKTFDSKLFPTFTTSFNKISLTLIENCSFIKEFNSQIEIINDILKNNVIQSTHIVKKNGEKLIVKKEFYKNIPDIMINTIVEYGIEKGIAYQLLRNIYSYKVEYIETYSEEGYVNNRFFDTIFSIDKFNIKNINPIATLYTRYTVFLEEKIVKTAIYAKETEIPEKYNVKIKTPTPAIFSEVFVDIIDDKTIKLTMPNIFSENSDTVELLLEYENYDLVSNLCDQNISVTQIKINEETVELTIDSLDVYNNNQTIRAAAMEEKDGIGSSEIFFKAKMEDMGLAVEEKISKHDSNKKATKLRLLNEYNLLNDIDDTPYNLKILRSKELFHCAKKNKAD